MIALETLPPPSSDGYRSLVERQAQSPQVEEEARAVLEMVRLDGDRAVRACTLRFDGVDVENALVPLPALGQAATRVSSEFRAALREAALNIEAVHRPQLNTEEVVTVGPGIRIWRSWRPIRRVGLYVPGGRAPYPSTVLMAGIPARLAGCPEVVLCSPPRPDGTIDEHVLAAAALAGISEVHAIGGVQAIGAMAYGTSSMARVDKIFGPGSAHVTAAKRLVFGQVAVDMPAGPSEVVVITDGTAPASWLTADLEAQAEHAPDALGVLLTTDRNLGEEVARLVSPSLMAQVRLFWVPTLAAALSFSNDFAPEHLILACREAEIWMGSVLNAGSVFLGSTSPAAAGDYATGANHVLPTGGMSRSFGPLSVDAFGRYLQVQSISPAGLERLAPVVAPLAQAEGFEKHWRSVAVRLPTAASGAPEAPVPALRIQRLDPYLWELSSQEAALRAGIPASEVVRFDTNSSPWTSAYQEELPPPQLNEYPDPSYPDLTRAIASYSGAELQSITVGAGADELIDLLAKAYLGPGVSTTIPRPSYSMFTVASRIAGARIDQVPLADRAHLVSSSRRSRLTWLCNPNNPTGDLLPLEWIAELARATGGVLVVDEAYFEFSGRSAIELCREFPNLVILRTMSKAYGLAGARVGYAISGPEIAAALAKVRPPGSISSLSSAIACRALANPSAMKANVERLLRNRDQLTLELAQLGLQPRESAGNFLLAPRPAGLVEALARSGLLVRTFPASSELEDWIRITVRSESENGRLLEGARRWREGHRN